MKFFDESRFFFLKMEIFMYSKMVLIINLNAYVFKKFTVKKYINIINFDGFIKAKTSAMK